MRMRIDKQMREITRRDPNRIAIKEGRWNFARQVSGRRLELSRLR
jgi:hypothetical protein